MLRVWGDSLKALQPFVAIKWSDRSGAYLWGLCTDLVGCMGFPCGWHWVTMRLHRRIVSGISPFSMDFIVYLDP